MGGRVGGRGPSLSLSPPVYVIGKRKVRRPRGSRRCHGKTLAVQWWCRGAVVQCAVCIGTRELLRACLCVSRVACRVRGDGNETVAMPKPSLCVCVYVCVCVCVCVSCYVPLCVSEEAAVTINRPTRARVLCMTMCEPRKVTSMPSHY